MDVSGELKRREGGRIINGKWIYLLYEFVDEGEGGGVKGRGDHIWYRTNTYEEDKWKLKKGRIISLIYFSPCGKNLLIDWL